MTAPDGKSLLVARLTFRAVPSIAMVLGRTEINVITRIMGLILAALGVEFIAGGLRQLFPLPAGGGA